MVGGRQHEAAVQRLVESYRQIPTGSPVRLAKRTSNLFRPRGRPAAERGKGRFSVLWSGQVDRAGGIR